MRQQWEKIILGEVLKLSIDAVPINPANSYQMAGVYSFGRGLFSREALTGSNTTYKHLHRLSKDQFVLSQPKGWEGALARVTDSHDGWFLSPVFPTFRADPNRLDINYLENYCKQSKVWEELRIAARGIGARRESVLPSQFLSLEIPLPPLAEQHRIVARIEELAAKIEEARGLRQQSSAECDALLRAMIFEAPSQLTAMKELVQLREPDVVVRKDEVYHFAGVYCFGRGVFKGQKKSGMDFAYPRLTRLQAGNFVYPKLMAWEGALGIVPAECDELVVSTEFPVFTVDESRVLPETLDVYFRTPSVWPVLAGESTGTNVRRRRLNPADFLNFKMPLPSMQTQLRLRAVKRKIDAVKQLQTETTPALDALMPSILDKAFKGEL